MIKHLIPNLTIILLMLLAPASTALASATSDSTVEPFSTTVTIDDPHATAEPIELTLTPRESSAGIVIDYSWRSRIPLDTSTIRFETSEGLRSSDGLPIPSVSISGEEGQGSLLWSSDNEGPHTVRAYLDALAGQTLLEKSSVTHFTVDEEGKPIPGLGATINAHEVDQGVVERIPLEGITLPQPVTHCITSFTVSYSTSNGASIPSAKRNLRVEGIEVNVRDSSNNILSTGFTDSNGEVGFTITTDPCDTNFNFYRRLLYKDGAAEKVRSTTLTGSLYTGTYTPPAAINNGDTVAILVSEAHTGGAYMLDHVVQSYKDTKAESYTISDGLEVRWEQGTHRASGCTTCYYNGGPIYMNGTDEDEYDEWSIYHEYGHHVHFDTAGSSKPGPAYGDHDCGGCHYWDSVHTTQGSALLEGWANFYIGVVKNTASIGIGNLDNPNANRADRTDIDCWGPYKECSVAAALWDAYQVAGTTFLDFIQTMQQNPNGLPDFYRDWINTGQPAQSSVGTAFEGHHIAARGDGSTWGDAGNTHGAATSVSPGSYKGDLTYDSPHEDTVDQNDFYAFSVTSGQVITATLNPPTGEDMDLYLRNPAGTIKASSTAGGDASESVSFTADSTGQWTIEVRRWNTAQGLYDFSISLGSADDLTSASIYSWPSSVNTGASYSVCWTVSGSGSITHTNIHWGTSSGSYPNSGSVKTGTAPQSFCDTLTAPGSAGTIYLAAHAIGPNDNFYGTERSISVVVVNDLTSVSIYSAPSTVSPGATFTVCWTVFGSGTISHTNLHYTIDAVTTTNTGTTSAFTGTASQSYCQSLTAPLVGEVRVRAHATGPNDNLLSSERRIGVLV